MTTPQEYAEYRAITGERIHPGDLISFPTYPKGGTVEVSAKWKVRDNDGIERPALSVRTNDDTLYGPLSSGKLRLLKRVNKCAGDRAGSRNLRPA